MNINTNALVCGNGPSLQNIDYKKLPINYDVFRCNQFYFEDKYFTGKDIKYAFFNPFVFFEQYYTAKQLIQKNEYTINNLICSSFGLPYIDGVNFISNFELYFSDAFLGHKIIKKLKDFFAFIIYNEVHKKQRITSGVYMCATAVALGYKNIYVCGIDFYQDMNNLYAFDNNKKNLLNICTDFKNEKFKFINHSMEYDLQALNFLIKTYNINIYSLNSNNYFNLAPDVGNDFVLNSKPKKYINDILLPTKYAQEIYHGRKNKLKENLYYKLIKDFLHLPSDIKHYIREKYANKNR
ncbi:TPA: alpha-2,3 sialyltransferase [Campylobacter coli]|nr:alpha-2,3 sialyltransferase [Campylobacter coli]HEB9430929.1 alpha-2,3 sialyltransferase [Campylobacter coli]